MNSGTTNDQVRALDSPWGVKSARGALQVTMSIIGSRETRDYSEVNFWVPGLPKRKNKENCDGTHRSH